MRPGGPRSVWRWPGPNGGHVAPSGPTKAEPPRPITPVVNLLSWHRSPRSDADAELDACCSSRVRGASAFGPSREQRALARLASHGQAPLRRHGSPLHRRVPVGASRRLQGEWDHRSVQAHRLIPFPGGKQKLLNVAHTRLKYGGGWCYFICPGCAKLAQTLYSIDDKPLCWRCCDKLNVSIAANGAWAARSACEPPIRNLDRLIAKLETTSRSGSTSASELGRQGAARLPQPTPDQSVCAAA